MPSVILSVAVLLALIGRGGGGGGLAGADLNREHPTRSAKSDAIRFVVLRIRNRHCGPTSIVCVFMNMKKFPRPDVSRLSREVRVGIATSALVVIGVVLFAYHWHATGFLLIAIGIALVAAFYFLVVRPARIPARRDIDDSNRRGHARGRPAIAVGTTAQPRSADPLSSAARARSGRGRSQADGDYRGNFGTLDRARDRAGAARPAAERGRGEQACSRGARGRQRHRA